METIPDETAAQSNASNSLCSLGFKGFVRLGRTWDILVYSFVDVVIKKMIFASIVN